MVVALGDEQLALAAGGVKLAGTLSGALTSLIREPMVCGARKSNGVPATGTPLAAVAGSGSSRSASSVGVDLDELAVGRARGRGLAGQVEVAVVGEVEHRGQLRGRRWRVVVDAELVARCSA